MPSLPNIHNLNLAPLCARSHDTSHEAQQILVRLHHALEGLGGADLLALIRVKRNCHLPVASPQHCGARAGRQPQHLGSIVETLFAIPLTDQEADILLHSS